MVLAVPFTTGTVTAETMTAVPCLIWNVTVPSLTVPPALATVAVRLSGCVEVGLYTTLMLPEVNVVVVADAATTVRLCVISTDAEKFVVPL